ncbi:YhdT family protein [Agarivorans sp.]|uniref:YhdT family protein n=1 Tax=Agarivorans sp. TaxID=1872412 RepID=UPI003D06E815
MMPQQPAYYQQANREAAMALLLALAYFVWWYCSAYGLAPPMEQQTLPELYWGLPLWFLMSCVVGPIIFTVLCALMVKYYYQDLPLDPEEHHE